MVVRAVRCWLGDCLRGEICVTGGLEKGLDSVIGDSKGQEEMG